MFINHGRWAKTLLTSYRFRNFCGICSSPFNHRSSPPCSRNSVVWTFTRYEHWCLAAAWKSALKKIVLIIRTNVLLYESCNAVSTTALLCLTTPASGIQLRLLQRENNWSSKCECEPKQPSLQGEESQVIPSQHMLFRRAKIDFPIQRYNPRENGFLPLTKIKKIKNSILFAPYPTTNSFPFLADNQISSAKIRLSRTFKIFSSYFFRLHWLNLYHS